MYYKLFCLFLASFFSLACVNTTSYLNSKFMKSSTNTPKVKYGELVKFTFQSKYIHSRAISIWSLDTLNAQSTSQDRYSVLYMHDGQMLFDETSTWNKRAWNMDVLMHDLEKRGITKVLIVGIDNAGENRHAEYFPEDIIATLSNEAKKDLLSNFKVNSSSNNYLKFLKEELVPFIGDNFPVYTDKAHTFMMGSSLGGLISLYALCKYPDTFSQVAALSTHWIGSFNDNEEIPRAINAYLRANLPDPKIYNVKVYMDHGSLGLDAFYGKYQEKVDATFKELAYDESSFYSLFFEGHDHNETDWSERVDIPLLFLFKDQLSAY